jgi:hypothetical protein
MPGNDSWVGIAVQGSKVQRFRVQGFRVQPSRRPKNRPVKSKKKLMNIEHRTLNVQHRIMNSVNFIKRTEQHPEQAPALQERSFPSKFDSAVFDVLKP